MNQILSDSISHYMKFSFSCVLQPHLHYPVTETFQSTWTWRPIFLSFHFLKICCASEKHQYTVTWLYLKQASSCFTLKWLFCSHWVQHEHPAANSAGLSGLSAQPSFREDSTRWSSAATPLSPHRAGLWFPSADFHSARLCQLQSTQCHRAWRGATAPSHPRMDCTHLG